MDKIELLESEIKLLARISLENSEEIDFDYFRYCITDCLFTILDVLKEIKNADQS